MTDLILIDKLMSTVSPDIYGFLQERQPVVSEKITRDRNSTLAHQVKPFTKLTSTHIESSNEVGHMPNSRHNYNRCNNRIK